MKKKRLKLKKITVPNLLKELQYSETLIYTVKNNTEHIKTFEKIYKSMKKRLKESKKDVNENSSN